MAYGSILNQNPILRDANGYCIFTESGKFNPADYGLAVGTLLNVVCVGGGQGGFNGHSNGGAAGHGGESRTSDDGGGGGSGGGFGAGGGGGGSKYDSGTTPGGKGGDAGEVVIKSIRLTSVNSISVGIGAGGAREKNGGNTTFGSYVTARGGGTFTNNIAPGGTGADVYVNASRAGGGGGGGGYIISNGLFGGAGGNGSGGKDFGAPTLIGGGGGSGVAADQNLNFNPASSIYGGHGGLAGQPGGNAGIGSGLCIVAW